MKRLILPFAAAAAFAALFLQSTSGLAHAATATATPTPAPPKDEDANRVGLSGVWEVQIQNSDGQTVYTHFKLTQEGNVLTGQYLDQNDKKFPLTGTVDGKNVRVVVALPTGSALVFAGSVENAMDMAGTLDTSSDMVGFTAAYRPKYKWIDNLAPNPGLGTGGSGVPY